MTVVDLLTLAARAPQLPGALCKGRPETFDLDGNATQKVRAAIALCHCCPALLPCTEYLAATPADQRPSGVVAGQLLQPGPVRSVGGPRASSPRTTPQASPMADKATAWLAKYLRTHPGAPAADVRAAAHVAGIRKGPLYTARARLHVEIERIDQCHTAWTLHHREELP